MNYRYGNIAMLKFNLQQLREVREHKEWVKRNWHDNYVDYPADIHKWDVMYGQTIQ